MPRIKNEIHQQVQQQTRQTLLDAAAVEFAREGFDRANINTISTQAGFAKGTIYNYFPSKQALLLALIDSIAQEHLDYMQVALQPIEDPLQRFECFFQAGFDFIALRPDRSRVMLNTVYGSNLEQKDYCFQAYRPMFTWFTGQVLLPGMQQGVFRQVDPLPMTILLMTIYLGTASQVDDQGRPRLSAGQVAQLTLAGLRA
jgi:AcrR family transcriptional regulator